MAGTVSSELEDGIATLRLSRSRGNAINAELVRDLSAAFRQAAADGQVRGVLLGSAGKLFCPGLDLVELSALDRAAMERFLGEFSALVVELYAFPKPVVAAVGGHAVAGGCVLALTADWRVLKRGALIGLAEVRVGVPFPFGVVTLLERSIAPEHLSEVTLFGRNYEGEQAVAVGLAHEAHAADGFEPHCRARLAELLDREPNAFAITKRYLRTSALERMREGDPLHAHEFLDAWFSPATRERVAHVVRELERR